LSESSLRLKKNSAFQGVRGESYDREFMSALFAFLERPKRREVHAAVRNNETIVKCLELTGRVLL